MSTLQTSLTKNRTLRVSLLSGLALVLLGAVLAITNGTTRPADAVVASSGGGASLCFGTVAVPQMNANTESIIDQESNLIVRTIGVGAQPSDNTFSGDGRYLFVSEYADQSIAMIDTSTNQILRTIQIGEYVGKIVSNFDGSVVWIGTQENGTYDPHLREVQTSDGSIIASFNSYYADKLLLSPDGNTIWLLSIDYPNTVVRELNAATLSETSATTLPLYAYGYALNSTGSIMYIADAESPGLGIAAFNTQTKNYTTLTRNLPIQSIAISPSGDTLYAVGGSYGSRSFYVIDIATDTWTLEPSIGALVSAGFLVGSKVSADGSKLYISNSNYAQGRIVVVDTADPSINTVIPMELNSAATVCPLAVDPAAPVTTTTAGADPLAPAFTG